MKQRMKPAVATLFCLSLLHVSAAEIPADSALPDWARNKWNALSEKNSLRISGKINPFVLRGQFDSDSKPDLAVLVESTRTGKTGIAILHRNKRPPALFGAGEEFGNGGDNFEWLDHWEVQDKGRFYIGPGQKDAVMLRSDGLLLTKEGAASALVYFRQGCYIWQQVGD